ncbi:FecR/PupR family sigma factor regulator [Methylocella sp.]|uniref:FecR/PupR family sigma factor regulator n=1 Tax=Methylocella sp. TaxID=1978226 RepID=UPI003783BEC9
MTAHGGDGPNDAQRDAAALWLMRRAGAKPSPSLERNFAAWLDADPDHERAYRDAARLWIALEGPALRLARRAAPLQGRRLRRLWISGPTVAALVLGALLCFGHGPRHDATPAPSSIPAPAPAR